MAFAPQPFTRTLLLAFGFAAGIAGGAQADCFDADFTNAATLVGTVRGDAPRVYFVQDAVFVAGCPNSSPACRTKAFVVPGDVVLLAGSKGDYTCAGITNAKGTTTVNWLPTASVAAGSTSSSSQRGWSGHWVAGEQDITISLSHSGELVVKGAATYGARDPDRVRRGAVNSGEIEARATPAGDAASFTMGDNRTLPYEQGGETDCRVRLLLRGPYLVAKDNNQCGGLNVTFSGIYHRKS